MKKFLTILVSAFVTLFTTASISSCSKDSEESLAGTTWTTIDGTAFVTLTFASESTFVMSHRDSEDEDGENESTTGNYTRNGNSITLIAMSNGSGTISGTINGNTITLMNMEGFLMVFTKS